MASSQQPTPGRKVIDVSGILDERAPHEYLHQELGFFAGYGFNFDALWDAITDDDLSQMPRHLVVEGLDDLERRLPGTYRKLRQCLEDYAREARDRTVSFVSGSSPGLERAKNDNV